MTSITIPDTGTQLSVRKVYTAPGGGGQSAFTIPFLYFIEADITVYVDSVLQVLTTDYTIAGTAVDGGFSGGTVNLVSPAVSVDVIVERSIGVQRITDFLTTGPFPMSALNLALDNMYAILQEQRSKVDRALRLDDSDSTENVILPDVDSRKGKYLYFDPTTGSPAAVEEISTSTTTIDAWVIANILPKSSAAAVLSALGVSAFIQTLLNDADATAAKTTLDIQGNIIDSSAFQQTWSNTAAATVIYSETIPGGTLFDGGSYNGKVSVDLFGKVLNNSGSNKFFIITVELGGVVIASYTVGSFATDALSRVWSLRMRLLGGGASNQARTDFHFHLGVPNETGVGSSTSTHGFGGYNTTPTIDCSVDKTLEVKVQMSAAHANFAFTKSHASCISQ